MAVQSKELSPINPDAIAAVRRAQPPKRPFWLPFLRLILQYTVTVPALALAAPFIILKNLFPFLRAHPLWTFRNGVAVELVRISIMCMSLIKFSPIPHKENGWREVGFFAPLLTLLTFSSAGQTILTDPKALKKELKIKAKRLDRVWFNPPPPEMFRGIISVRVPGQSNKHVSSPRYSGPALIKPEWAKARTRGYWYMRAPGIIPPQPSDKGPRTRPIVLYVHGGAGVSFAAGDIFMGACLTATMARTAEIDIFSVDYDLAPYARYPTTVVQLLGAWIYLTKDLGYHPSQIYIGGDSYGAFATLAFARWMRDTYPLLDVAKSGGKPPAIPGLILLSPWLHAGDPGEQFPSRRANTKYDIVTEGFARWGLGGLGIGPEHADYNPLDFNDPWVSPVEMSAEEFAELPPCFVGNGGLETLIDEGKLFVQKAHKAGIPVEHFIEPGQSHDFGTNPAEIPAAKKQYRAIGRWIAGREAAKTKQQATA